jgi:hypothetical protein
MNMHAAVRAAAVEMLRAYGADAGVRLQVYPGRPKSLHPPTAFVDRLTESADYTAHPRPQRTVRAEVLVLFGLFDSADAADQKDAFADGFLDWATDNVHAAGANTTVAVTEIEDEPAWTPDWLPRRDEQLASYYATRITLEGYGQG